jgi:hypothetical protein
MCLHLKQAIMKALLYLCTILLIWSCSSSHPVNNNQARRQEPTPRDIWAGALRQCANDDFLEKQKKKLLFLGISNPYGPGSCWRPSAENFEVRWSLPEAIKEPGKPTDFIESGVENPCSTVTSLSSVTQLETLIGVSVLPINLINKLNISRAKSITSEFTKWRKDNLRELLYEKWAQQPEQSGIYGQDVMAASTAGPTRYIIKSAIWVEGFKMTIHFDKSYLDSLEVKVNLKSIADINNNLRLSRTADDKIEFKSINGFYLVATLLPINGGSFGSFPGAMFRSEADVPPSARAVNNPTGHLTPGR